VLAIGCGNIIAGIITAIPYKASIPSIGDYGLEIFCDGKEASFGVET
jgi:predicted membrane-bound spermidine synthase